MSGDLRRRTNASAGRGRLLGFALAAAALAVGAATALQARPSGGWRSRAA